MIGQWSRASLIGANEVALNSVPIPETSRNADEVVFDGDAMLDVARYEIARRDRCTTDGVVRRVDNHATVVPQGDGSGDVGSKIVTFNQVPAICLQVDAGASEVTKPVDDETSDCAASSRDVQAVRSGWPRHGPVQLDDRAAGKPPLRGAVDHYRLSDNR